MINGVVTADREAIVRLTVRSSDHDELEIDCVIDTGFTDYMTLPNDVIRRLGLPVRETARFTLADGSHVAMDLHRVDVLWDGAWRGALAAAADGAPLIGMALLEGFRLVADVVCDGAVTITRI